jgi:streptomycin 6-kinase
MTAIPDALRATLIEMHGVEGAAWLARLPALLKSCEKRWSVRLQAPFQNLSYHYVAPATGPGGAKWVLKAGYPNPDLVAESEALQLFDGRGAVRLLQTDPDQGLLLLEQLVPGTPLTQLEDDESATSIAAQLMQQIWRPVPTQHSFPTVADWAKGLKRLRAHFNGAYGPFPPGLVERADSLFAELLASSAENMLLHGDLHHTNILSAGRQPWLAIDPKGVVGEPAYEASAFMVNPIPKLLQYANPERILRRRADQFAEALGLERARLSRWAFAQAVLSGWWSYEDHGRGWEYYIACAEILAQIT